MIVERGDETVMLAPESVEEAQTVERIETYVGGAIRTVAIPPEDHDLGTGASALVVGRRSSSWLGRLWELVVIVLAALAVAAGIELAWEELAA